jgi:rfaE bifunctional protein kinase chain/domain
VRTQAIESLMPKPSKQATGQAQRLLRIIDAFPRIGVTVLGDLVADEFVFGEISRVSREAPVLILKHRERTVAPGAAGNAVFNLADLGVNVLPVGVVGDDEPGRLLLKAFKKKKISISGIIKLKGHATVTKTRILAGQVHSSRQQVVRIDREPDTPLEQHTVRDLIACSAEFVKASDALLISDYGYGAATPAMLQVLRSKNKLDGMAVTLDSRYRMLEYSGVSAATPNEPEVEEALRTKIGNDSGRVFASGKTLMQKMKLDSLLITRGRDGMVVFSNGSEPVNIPIHGSDEVADVTGAGDTVIATYTAALATGADPIDAAYLANFAGGIVVMKRGTATVSANELRQAIETSAMHRE